MSAELFHVIASLVRHQREQATPIPLIQRWDPYERELSDPLPFLL